MKALRLALFWSALVVALLMLTLMLVPVDVWRPPQNDLIYNGFEPNLIATNPAGFPLPGRGAINVPPQAVELSAQPNSAPSFHLLTGRLSAFQARMDLLVVEAPSGTVPLRIGVWSPRSKAGYFLTFGSGPNNLVTTQILANGGAAQTLVGGEVVRQETLGSYSPEQPYHLDIALDKKSGVLETRLSGREAPPSNHPMLAIKGGPADPGYADVISQPIKVVGGRGYRFGALLKVPMGSDAYKLSLGWLDQKKTFLGYAGTWRNLAGLS